MWCRIVGRRRQILYQRGLATCPAHSSHSVLTPSTPSAPSPLVRSWCLQCFPKPVCPCVRGLGVRHPLRRALLDVFTSCSDLSCQPISSRDRKTLLPTCPTPHCHSPAGCRAKRLSWIFLEWGGDVIALLPSQPNHCGPWVGPDEGWGPQRVDLRLEPAESTPVAWLSRQAGPRLCCLPLSSCRAALGWGKWTERAH